MALKNHSISCGVGGSYSIFEGSYHYRLIFFTTPIDDETSDMFYSIWWPKLTPTTTSDVPPDHSVSGSSKQFLTTLWDDLEIWRYQVYVETPAFAKQDAKPYGALRKWAKQFYEIEPAGGQALR